MTMTFAADGAVAFLLVITIFYAAKLSRRLSALRADKSELRALVQNLAQAAQSAEAGVKGLKNAADEIGRQLEQRVHDGQALREDLAYMLDRGGVLADRLEGGLRGAAPKPEVSKSRPPEPRAQREDAVRREPRPAQNFIQEMAARLAPSSGSRSERDLLRALAGRR